MWYDRVLGRLRSLRRHPSGWSACCPAHDDRRPSLVVWLWRSGEHAGQLTARCRSRGCRWLDIVRALGTEPRDWMPPDPLGGSRTMDQGRVVAEYDYHDLRGAVAYRVVRYEPKDFRVKRPDGKGGWLWNLDGVERVLYRLPWVVAARPDAPVLLVEGEAKADLLCAHGFLATTSGAANSWRHEFGKALAGRRVVVLPDNDPAGERYAAAVCGSLVLWGVEGLRVCRLPGLEAGGDVVDWWKGALPHVSDADKRRALIACVRACPEYAPRRAA